MLKVKPPFIKGGYCDSRTHPRKAGSWPAEHWTGMTQVVHGLRSLLSHPGNYDFLQGLVGAGRLRRALAEQYIQARAGMKVLDIGCGTGGILEFLPDVDYLGFDLNADYVAAAARRFGPSHRFLCADVNAVPAEAEGSFDRILALGLLHHLDDHEVGMMLKLARRLLAPGGRLVTLDSCYRSGQSSVARFLIDRDRGRNTRAEQAYVALARSVFPEVASAIREDLLRLPYTHIILTCGRSAASQDLPLPGDDQEGAPRRK